MKRYFEFKIGHGWFKAYDGDGIDLGVLRANLKTEIDCGVIENGNRSM